MGPSSVDSIQARSIDANPTSKSPSKSVGYRPSFRSEPRSEPQSGKRGTFYGRVCTRGFGMAGSNGESDENPGTVLESVSDIVRTLAEKGLIKASP